MSKRRTRKQKETAKHSFKVSWAPKPKKTVSEPDVKRQFQTHLKAKSPDKSKKEKSRFSVKDDNLASIRHDIIKSLGSAAIIVGLEVVIYLYWQFK